MTPLLGSVQLKFALSYIILIAVILSILNIYPILVSQDLVFQSKKSSLESKAAVVASALIGLEYLSAEGVERVMNLLDNMNLTRLIITDSDAVVLYDTQNDGESIGKYALLPEIVMALRGDDVFYSRYTEGAFLSKASIPVVYKSTAIGAVYVFERDTEQADLLLGIQSNLWSLSVVVSFFVLFISLFLSKALTRRIGVILRSIRIVREGEYSHRIDFAGSDELAQLADEFNKLTDRLQTTEEIRRRFVSDASHELKTPLASIRLLTDSILQNQDIDASMTREFVEDIGNEAERLTRITEKLLDLTRLDAAPNLDETPVDFKRVIIGALHMLRPLAGQDGVEIRTDISGGCVVMANEDDIYQIVFNLVENAIKYNVPGGYVLVALDKNEETVTLVVEDSGVGIPEEDMPRIFDRFYRVEKARSRQAGGTGLGLSIVADAVTKHGGAVEVNKNQEKGTCFHVSFPAAGTEDG